MLNFDLEVEKGRLTSLLLCRQIVLIWMNKVLRSITTLSRSPPSIYLIRRTFCDSPPVMDLRAVVNLLQGKKLTLRSTNYLTKIYNDTQSWWHSIISLMEHYTLKCKTLFWIPTFTLIDIWWSKFKYIFNVVHFLTPVLIRNLWQLKTVVFLNWCLICAVQLVYKINLSPSLVAYFKVTDI